MAEDTVQANAGIGVRETRRRALLTGKLVYGPALMTMDCSIRDRSPRGARVRLATAELLPRKLWFLDLRESAAFEAEVIWRRQPDVGLLLGPEIRLADVEGHAGVLLRRLLADARPRTANDLNDKAASRFD